MVNIMAKGTTENDSERRARFSRYPARICDTRITEAQAARLRDLCERHGLIQADVVRLALDIVLDEPKQQAKLLARLGKAP